MIQERILTGKDVKLVEGRNKMKYTVIYAITTSWDAVVEAENKLEAKKKVKEVIPDAKIENIWEVEEHAV
jgi:hypothetical protein